MTWSDLVLGFFFQFFPSVSSISLYFFSFLSLNHVNILAMCYTALAVLQWCNIQCTSCAYSVCVRCACSYYTRCVGLSDTSVLVRIFSQNGWLLDRNEQYRWVDTQCVIGVRYQAIQIWVCLLGVGISTLTHLACPAVVA